MTKNSIRTQTDKHSTQYIFLSGSHEHSFVLGYKTSLNELEKKTVSVQMCPLTITELK